MKIGCGSFEVTDGLRVDFGPNVNILRSKGKLRIGYPCNIIQAAVSSLLDEGAKKIAIDLSGISELDSSGLGAIITVFTHARNNGCSLVFFKLTAKVKQLLEVTRLDTVLQLFDDEDSAVRALTEPK